MKYKLLKDLPGIGSGIEFLYKEGDGNKGVEIVGGKTIGGLSDFVKLFGIDNDFFELITEKKTFNDLMYGDYVYRIGISGEIYFYKYYNGPSRSETFFSKQEAEDEYKRREWRVRKNKFIPKKNERYYYPTSGRKVNFRYNSLFDTDYIFINQGLAFQTEKECQDAIDNNDIVRLFYTII